MKWMEKWSRKTNPQTGDKFEHFRRYMESTNNGEMDIDRLLKSEYGEELTRLLDLRYTYETDPMGEDCIRYYREKGVVKQMMDSGNFYSRWALFSPLEIPENHKLPLIIWCHGGKEIIEEEEFATHLSDLVASEKILVAMPQNTNVDYQEYMIEKIREYYPVDSERVYSTGFSQGSKAAAAAMMRMPEKLAGAALVTGPIFDSKDNKNIPFTIEEAERLRAAFVPYIQLNNQCDAGNYVPINHFRPRRKTEPVENHLSQDPRYQVMDDPTRSDGGKAAVRVDPPKDGDVGQWLMGRLNLRLFLQGCAPREARKCLSYYDTPDTELHHVLGFYGDRESTRVLYGVKHYFADIDNADGLDAFRYVVVENTNHWPMVTAAELIWEYLRQFRRDSKTGRIMNDVYEPVRSDR